MKILLQTPRDRAEQWQRALRAALPEATIAVWPEAMAEPDYALVWRPPAELFARTKPKRAIFNLGAGVEALLALPGLPENVPVIRL
ncbi:MAG: glyoxylate/hydroxypyruvate reductase A, partial [Casimicrobiaceae bacterium]